MKEIQLPQKIKFEEIDDKNATVIVEPLYPGYGLTLGNALRRVLISSLPGSAVTAIKIKGVQHEFSTMPYVKEDIVDIILNIKQLRLKLLQGDSAILKLDVKGEKTVTAKDIKANADVEIVNPSLKIATLTDKAAALEIEFTVKSGLGYMPVESREKEKLELGYIAIDAIFTPVLKSRYNLENVRVEQMTNYDRLTLEILTDGTIKPKDAFYEAAKILNDHFNYLAQETDNKQKKHKEKSDEVKIDDKKEEKAVIEEKIAETTKKKADKVKKEKK